MEKNEPSDLEKFSPSQKKPTTNRLKPPKGFLCCFPIVYKATQKPTKKLIGQLLGFAEAIIKKPNGIMLTT